MDDLGFVDHVADHLAALPGVLAVTLGGSRPGRPAPMDPPATGISPCTTGNILILMT